MENFYVLYGLNKGLIKIELEKLLKKFKNCDLIKYDMSTTEIESIIEDARTVSLFGQKKVIILEDSFFLGTNKNIDNLKLLEDYIEHYNPDSYLIFICNLEKLDTRKKINKLLSKHKVMELNTLNETDLSRFVQEYLKKDGYKIEDIPFFLKRVGTNLSNIQNELDKLEMLTIEKKVITNDDINKVTTKVVEEEIFSLTDAIILKDTKTALHLLDEFLNLNYDEIQIIMLLSSQFHFLFQVKRLLNKNKTTEEIAKILEVNPYRVKYTTKKLYTYTEDEILGYIKRLAKMDHDIKLGLIQKNLALRLFILYKDNT